MISEHQFHVDIVVYMFGDLNNVHTRFPIILKMVKLSRNDSLQKLLFLPCQFRTSFCFICTTQMCQQLYTDSHKHTAGPVSASKLYNRNLVFAPLGDAEASLKLTNWQKQLCPHSRTPIWQGHFQTILSHIHSYCQPRREGEAVNRELVEWL